MSTPSVFSFDNSLDESKPPSEATLLSDGSFLTSLSAVCPSTASSFELSFFSGSSGTLANGSGSGAGIASSGGCSVSVEVVVVVVFGRVTSFFKLTDERAVLETLSAVNSFRKSSFCK